MRIQDAKLGMSVRISTTPATNDEPGDMNPEGPFYVRTDAANAVAQVVTISENGRHSLVLVRYTANAEVEYPEEIEDDGTVTQWVHPSHLTVYTAEASPATVASFDDIVGGTELDSLRDLGNTMDVADVDENGEGSIDGITVTENPTPGAFSIYPPQEGDRSGYTDPDGDQLDTFFREQNCGTHGYEAAFTFAVNGEAVLMNPATALQLAQYIADRVERIKKRGQDIQ